MFPIGVAGAPQLVFVGARGRVEHGETGLALDWLVASGEGWHAAADGGGVRQHALADAGGVETRLAVRGGDVVQRVYGTGGAPAVAVMECTNESPEDVALAVIATGRAADVGAVIASAPYLQWADGPDEAAARAELLVGATQPGTWTAPRNARATVSVARSWALPRGASLRVAVALAPRPAPDASVVRGTPDLDAVRAGWETLLGTGMRFESDDAHLDDLVLAARAATLVLASADRPRPGGALAVALEDWGADREAAAVWHRLGRSERKIAARREDDPNPWGRVKAVVGRSANGVVADPIDLLVALRATLLDDRADATIELFPGFPPDWLGRSVAVHDAPTRHGNVSFAIRWHGGRPALLWDGPDGVVLRCPRLDPAWSAPNGGSGEGLLAEPDVGLLPMGQAPLAGETVEPPSSFN